jgi:hypothetical protein
MASNPTITDPPVRARLAKALRLVRCLWKPGEKARQRLADWWRLEHRVDQLRLKG